MCVRGTWCACGNQRTRRKSRSTLSVRGTWILIVRHVGECFYMLSHLCGLGVWLLGTCSFGFRRDNPRGSERTRGDQLLTLPAHPFSSAGTRPYYPLPCIFLRLAQSSPCWLLGAFISDLLCSTRQEDWRLGFQCTDLCCCHLPTSLVSALWRERISVLKLCMS